MLVNYTHQFNYRLLEDNSYYPVIVLTVSDKDDFEILAVIDSGATASVFSVQIAEAVGIENIFQGEERIFRLANGRSLIAYGHELTLIVENNKIKETIYFSETEIPRNLIGRTFLDKLQIGFREHHQQFYIRFEA